MREEILKDWCVLVAITQWFKIIANLIKKGYINMDKNTCYNCCYFDIQDNHKSQDEKHPNSIHWSHICIAKYIEKYASDKACIKHFISK